MSGQFSFIYSDFNNSREDAGEVEISQRIRNWYPKVGICKSDEKTKWHVPINVQLPKSKWDSEDEDKLSNDTEKEQENETKSGNSVSEHGKHFVYFIYKIKNIFNI